VIRQVLVVVGRGVVIVEVVQVVGLVEVVGAVGVGTVTLPRPRAFVPLGSTCSVEITGTQGWGTREPLPNVPTRRRTR